MTSDKYLATGFDVTQKIFIATCTILILYKGYTKFIMPAGIMSSAQINIICEFIQIIRKPFILNPDDPVFDMIR